MGINNRQRTRRSRVLSASDGTTAFFHRPLLAGRARQLVLLHGYEMTYLAGNNIVDTNDREYTVQLLTVSPENPYTDEGDPGLTAVVQGVSDETLRRASVVAWYQTGYRQDGADGGSQVLGLQSGWHPTALYLPGVQWHIRGAADSVALSCRVSVEIEYEWVDATLEEIAAVNLIWGRDPDDFDAAPEQGAQ